MKAIANWKVSVFSVGLLASILGGLALGWAFPKQVHAANYWEIWFDIPVGGTTGEWVYLNCGWHWGPCPQNSGESALDWDPTTGEKAYFAGAAKYDGAYLKRAADVVAKYEPFYNNSLCRNVVARVWKLSGHILSRQVYTHVYRGADLSFAVYADSSPLGFRIDVGEAKYPDLQNCPITGPNPHVHNYPELEDAIHWGGFPSASQCSDACGWYNNQTWVHWVDWIQ